MTLKRGDKIPGSRFVRDFCIGCGEPIRVSVAGRGQKCSDCGTRPKQVKGNADAGASTDRAYHGGLFNRGEW